MRYIELNPVRANMVEKPAEYIWSSYEFNGLGKENKLLTLHPLYLELGSISDERCFAYRELFRNRINDHLIHELREAVNLELVFGRDDFKDKIEVMLDIKVRKGRPGRPRVEEEQGVYFIY